MLFQLLGVQSMLDLPILGASLYVPATHPDLSAIAAAEKLSNVRSIIFCTEDAVAPADLGEALSRLADALDHLSPADGRLRFVRVRNPAIMKQVLSMSNVGRLDGFVLPKVTANNFDTYMEHLKNCENSNHWVMPTLETREVFNDASVQDLLRKMESSRHRERILTLRIGGNDLLSLLRMRRPRGRTIYETPIGQVIARLATTFIPYGFSLSAPVFEHLDDVNTLRREIEEDLNHGLLGKTAIHPDQVPLIERHYRVCERDVEAALRILHHDAPGVFKLYHSMCEPATHRPWAYSVLEAARCFGSEKAA
jgi:citrate lyase beta subunit